MAKEREYGKYVALSSWDASLRKDSDCSSGEGYNTIEEALEAAKDKVGHYPAFVAKIVTRLDPVIVKPEITITEIE